MTAPRFLSLKEAVSLIPSEASLSLGGFDIVRAPMALVFELVRQGGRRVELITAPNPLAMDVLIGAKVACKVTAGFSGFQYQHGFAVGPMWKQAVESHEVDYREVDVYAILSGLRASALGLPFLPLTDIDGSELTDPERWTQMEHPFDAKQKVTVTRPIRPDFALIHAQAADRTGNLRIDDPIVDELVAKASTRVIATVETFTDQVERPSVPFYRVDALVEAPRGAWPSACPGYYPVDEEHLHLYMRMAEGGRFADYRRQFIDRKEGTS